MFFRTAKRAATTVVNSLHNPTIKEMEKEAVAKAAPVGAAWAVLCGMTILIKNEYTKKDCAFNKKTYRDADYDNYKKFTYPNQFCE